MHSDNRYSEWRSPISGTSTEFSRMLLDAVLLQFAFTGTEEPILNHEKQSQTKECRDTFGHLAYECMTQTCIFLRAD